MKTYIRMKAIKAKHIEKDGYESWSPKEVFEEAYYECDSVKHLE